MGNKTQWSMKRGKRDKRKRKAGKSRVMSFSQREASLRNNLSAQGEEVKKKEWCKGQRKLSNTRKREETPHTGATMLTVPNGRWIFIIKSLYDINRINVLNGHTNTRLTYQAAHTHTHTPKQLLHSDTTSNMMSTDEIRTHWARLLNRRRPC